MQGNPQAQFNLALMYHSGAGVARNEAEAVAWYHKAAENGSSPGPGVFGGGLRGGLVWIAARCGKGQILV